MQTRRVDAHELRVDKELGASLSELVAVATWRLRLVVVAAEL